MCRGFTCRKAVGVFRLNFTMRVLHATKIPLDNLHAGVVKLQSRRTRVLVYTLRAPCFVCLASVKILFAFIFFLQFLFFICSFLSGIVILLWRSQKNLIFVMLAGRWVHAGQVNAMLAVNGIALLKRSLRRVFQKGWMVRKRAVSLILHLYRMKHGQSISAIKAGLRNLIAF